MYSTCIITWYSNDKKKYDVIIPARYERCKENINVGILKSLGSPRSHSDLISDASE